MRLTTRHLAGLLAFAALSANAQAQPVFSGNVALTSSFVWRGVTSTSRPVIQPDITLTVPLGGGTFTLGGWASIEPARYDGPTDISAVYGLLPGPAFTQYSAWMEQAFVLRGADIIAGATAYAYPPVADLAAQFNTVELYGSATFPVWLAPSLSIWYDLAAVRGAYVEAALAHDATMLGVPLSLTAAAGLSAGQGPDASGRQAYFAQDGITHVELSVTSEIVLGPFSIAPTIHLIRAYDAAARTTSTVSSSSMKVWAGASLSWSTGGGADR